MTCGLFKAADHISDYAFSKYRMTGEQLIGKNLETVVV
jgi:hypothetical protein